MRFLATPIPGVILVEPDVHRDARGFFLETYHAPRYRDGGIRETFVQDNHSRSARDTLRGLHIQLPERAGQARARDRGRDLGRRGRRAPRLADLRPALRRRGSRREDFEQLYVPPGLAHGFLRALRGGAGRVQVHRSSTTRRPSSRSRGTTPSSRSRGRSRSPLLSRARSPRAAAARRAGAADRLRGVSPRWRRRGARRAR